jgi:hypothetical protein
MDDTKQAARRVDPLQGGLMNPEFRYRTAADTDVSKTWAKYRRQQAEAAKKPAPKVTPIKAKSKEVTRG